MISFEILKYVIDYFISYLIRPTNRGRPRRWSTQRRARPSCNRSCRSLHWRRSISGTAPALHCIWIEDFKKYFFPHKWLLILAISSPYHWHEALSDGQLHESNHLCPNTLTDLKLKGLEGLDRAERRVLVVALDLDVVLVDDEAPPPDLEKNG